MREKLKKYLILVTIIGGLLFFNSFISAHPGRTDSSGCHTCRTNCTSWGLSFGEYHCHRAKSLPQPKEPIKSHRGDPVGYTEPAPEYKIPSEDTAVPKINPKQASGASVYNSQDSQDDFSDFIWIGFIGLVVGYIIYSIRKH